MKMKIEVQHCQRNADWLILEYTHQIDIEESTLSRHVAKGGSEGADEPPFFSNQKKKVDGVRVWQLRVPGAIAPACIALGLRIHGPEPNLESVAVQINVKRSAFLRMSIINILCDQFLKHLAGKIADRDSSEYSCVIAWLRCRISFAL